MKTVNAIVAVVLLNACLSCSTTPQNSTATNLDTLGSLVLTGVDVEAHSLTQWCDYINDRIRESDVPIKVTLVCPADLDISGTCGLKAERITLHEVMKILSDVFMIRFHLEDRIMRVDHRGA